MNNLTILLIAICHVLGLISAVHAVTSTQAQGTIAWLASLLVCPYVAVPAYWVLGHSRFHGSVTARCAGHHKLNELARRAYESVKPHLLSETATSEAGRAAERLARIPFLTGNQVELLVDGKATFESILSGVDAAQTYILFQFFIVHDDEIGRAIQQCLIQRAQAGIRVYFLYDEVGSHDLPRAYLDALRSAGIEVYDFHTCKGPRNRFQINFRNHRKIDPDEFNQRSFGFKLAVRLARLTAPIQ